MLLAASLGAALYAVLQVLPERAQSFGALPFMLGSLAAVWAINFLAVLPAVNPSFVHMLPYDATLASKLAFGAVAATMLRSMERRRMPNRAVARQRGVGTDYRPDAPPAQAVSGGRAAVALVAGLTPWPQARAAPTGTADCAFFQQRLQGELLMLLAPSQYGDDRLAAALGPQVQLG